MHGLSNALRVDEPKQGEARVISRISEHKRAPMHFNFDLSLKRQAELKRDEYKISEQEAAPFLEYLDSRPWSPAELPDGADAWVVVGDPIAILGDYDTATRAAVNKLRLRSNLHVNDDLSGMPSEFHPVRRKRTSQHLALLRQVQPQGKLKVMAVQLGFGERHRSYSHSQAESHFAKVEFGIGDFELLNILSTYPSCLDNQEDRGLIAAGDQSYEGFVPAYSVQRRMLRRHVKPIDEIDHGFRVATAFLFK